MYRQIFPKNKKFEKKQTNFPKNRKFQKMCEQFFLKIENYEKRTGKFNKKHKKWDNVLVNL